jgi:hypothetical protein
MIRASSYGVDALSCLAKLLLLSILHTFSVAVAYARVEVPGLCKYCSRYNKKLMNIVGGNRKFPGL